MNENELQVRIEQWLEQLQASGCRLTQPRRAIVQILASSQRAITASEIHELAQQESENLGLVSVYRTLETLEDLKLVQRVHLPDHCQAYLAAFEGHQHLIICQRCGRADFFDGDNLNALVKRVETQSGFAVTDHWLQLFGTCADCQAQHP